MNDRRHSYEYQRILDILEDYWLSEPDEEKVMVWMYFRKSDGQEQAKRIVWTSDEYKEKYKNDPLPLISAKDLLERRRKT